MLKSFSFALLQCADESIGKDILLRFFAGTTGGQDCNLGCIPRSSIADERPKTLADIDRTLTRITNIQQQEDAGGTIP